MASSTESPALALSRRIVTRFVSEGLLTPDRAERFANALADGTLEQGDWRLALEVDPKPAHRPQKK